MTSPKAIGLVLHYIDAERTSACLQSLLNEGLEAVLVWDNTADAGRSASRITQLRVGDPRVVIAGNGRNLGFAAGVNRGLERISSDWPGRPALLINNDAVLLPGAMVRLESTLQANPSAHVVYPDIDHGGWIRGTIYYHRFTGLITDRLLPGSFPYASGCCLLVNLPVVGASLLDEDFFMYGEDIELGRRLSVKPGAMIYAQGISVLHEGSVGSGMATAFYESHVNFAHFRLARKISRGPLDFTLAMAGLLPVLFARSIVRSVRYKDLMPIKALYLAFWGAVRRRAWLGSST